MRRAPSSRTRSVEPNSLLSTFNEMGVSDALSDDDSEEENGKENIKNRRRLRRSRSKKKSSNTDQDQKRSSKKKQSGDQTMFDDEMDPYDSDPGESYRAHCMKVQGLGTKSCLRMPPFLKSGKKDESFETHDIASSSTSPPSPIGSESEDLVNQTPNSLPDEMTRVRYSLRSSIGDGSTKQPTGPSIMDRRELRPNGVALNVSHWSDTGSRAYMEDR